MVLQTCKNYDRWKIRDINEEFHEEIVQLALHNYDQLDGTKYAQFQAQKPIKIIKTQPMNIVYGSQCPIKGFACPNAQLEDPHPREREATQISLLEVVPKVNVGKVTWGYVNFDKHWLPLLSSISSILDTVPWSTTLIFLFH